MKKRIGDMVPCGCCNGTGNVRLGKVYQETLDGLRRLSRKGYCVANVHAAWFGCEPTTLSNRLRHLHNLGFATYTVVGKQKRYVAV